MAFCDNDEIYPNSPLSDVACEVRFAGEMQIECERHRFWDAVRKDYPQILVPFAQEGKAMALQHYRFRSEADNRVVSVALNSIAYSEGKYRGHKAFIAEFQRLLGIFRDTYPKIGNVSRVGWRYINLMPFTKEHGFVPLNQLLKLKFELPLNLHERPQHINIQWTAKHSVGTAVIRIATVPNKGVEGQEALLLDIDYGNEGPNLSWDNVSDALCAMRLAGRETFETLITDSYREYLRGEKL